MEFQPTYGRTGFAYMMSAVLIQRMDNLPLMQATHSPLIMQNTRLHYAAGDSDPDSVANVLSNKPTPPVNAISGGGCTALQIALMRVNRSNPDQKFHESVRLLLEAGADPRLPNIMQNGLVTASRVNCPKTIRILYCNMVQREPCKIKLLLWFKNAGWSLMHFTWTRDLQLTKLYIDFNPGMLIYNGHNAPALHQLVEARASAAFFELLLWYNMDPNDRHPETGNTPLHRVCELAGEWDNHDVVEKLLALGANPNLMNRGRQNCLHLAAKAGSDLVVRLLLKYNVETDRWDSTGMNAMHHAVVGGSKAIIATLRNIGLSVLDKCRSDAGDSAIHLASFFCHPEAVAYLIKLGLNPNELDYKRKTPLHYAVMAQDSHMERRRTETVDILVEYGANVHFEDNRNLSPLKYCLKKSLLDNAGIIIRHFALEQPRDPKLTEYLMKKIRKNKKLKEVYDNCLAELQAMKKCNVFGWASVHTILTAPENVVRPLLRNPDLVKTMYRYIIDRIIYAQFPIYSTTVINRFTRYKEEQRRVIFAREGLKDLLSHWDPSGFIAENVVKLLGEDIDALVEHRQKIIDKNMQKVCKELTKI